MLASGSNRRRRKRGEKNRYELHEKEICGSPLKWHITISNKTAMLMDMKRGISDIGLSNPIETRKTSTKVDKSVTNAKLIPKESKKVFVGLRYIFRSLRMSIPGRNAK